jgi:hypothetical protein
MYDLGIITIHEMANPWHSILNQPVYIKGRDDFSSFEHHSVL